MQVGGIRGLWGLRMGVAPMDTHIQARGIRDPIPTTSTTIVGDSTHPQLLGARQIVPVPNQQSSWLRSDGVIG